MRSQSVFSILEDNQCYQITAEGLKNDYPGKHKSLIDQLEENEMYFALEWIVNKTREHKDDFVIFNNPGYHLPLVIERKDRYTKEEVKAISDVTGIGIEIFDLVHQAVKD